ncbi:hypothetical protein T07_3049 [Trichinella nelsoni]|uniref:Uncharacterized protein n=1 Tax=Trichinella nelsoni TaxID=6336 RepID=A0A0V0SLD0_9BILA|nr:hypothetical protein T07_3049 [Trichinella nelsoni]
MLSVYDQGKKNLIFQNFTPANVEDQSNFFLDTLHFDERLIDSVKQLMGFMGKLMGECGPLQLMLQIIDIVKNMAMKNARYSEELFSSKIILLLNEFVHFLLCIVTESLHDLISGEYR